MQQGAAAGPGLGAHHMGRMDARNISPYRGPSRVSCQAGSEVPLLITSTASMNRSTDVSTCAPRTPLVRALRTLCHVTPGRRADVAEEELGQSYLAQALLGPVPVALLQLCIPEGQPDRVLLRCCQPEAAPLHARGTANLQIGATHPWTPYRRDLRGCVRGLQCSCRAGHTGAQQGQPAVLYLRHAQLFAAAADARAPELRVLWCPTPF